MNFLEKFIVKKVAQVEKSESAISYPAIDEFVADLSRRHAVSNP